MLFLIERKLSSWFNLRG